jgi:serine/threonine protein kinase
MEGSDQLIQDYLYSKPLHSTPLYTAYAGRHNLSPIPLVVFKIPKCGFPTEKDAHHYWTKMQFFLSCQHPFLAEIYDMIDQETDYFIISEFVKQGDIQTLSPFNETAVKSFFTQLISLLDYFHYQNITLYPSFSPVTVTLDQSCNIKFSPVTLVLPCKDCNSTPESLFSDQYIDRSDIWSLGLITYIMLFGNHPFSNTNLDATLRDISVYEIDIPSNSSPILSDLFRQLFAKSPQHPASIHDLV